MTALTSDVHTQDATLTLRFVRNFEYRTIRYFVLKKVNLSTWTGAQLLEECKRIVAEESGFRPYKTIVFDTIKVYTHAHQTKTQNLAINFDHDDELLTDKDNSQKTLFELGVRNETELSVYNLEAYLKFKENPEMKW